MSKIKKDYEEKFSFGKAGAHEHTYRRKTVFSLYNKEKIYQKALEMTKEEAFFLPFFGLGTIRGSLVSNNSVKKILSAMVNKKTEIASSCMKKKANVIVRP